MCGSTEEEKKGKKCVSSTPLIFNPWNKKHSRTEVAAPFEMLHSETQQAPTVYPGCT